MNLMISKKFVWIAVGILALILIIAYAVAVNEKKSATGEISAVSVPCLNENQPLLQHIHPILKIFVNGQAEKVPADIGLSVTCEKALHTHDDTGELHVEAQDLRAYTLGDFFEVWNKPFQRDGFYLQASVDGQEVSDPAGIILKDKEEIILNYFPLQN